MDSEIIRLKIKGRRRAYYELDVYRENGKVYIHCNCRQGMYHKMCRHHMAVLEGNQEKLFEHDTQTEAWNTVKAMLLEQFNGALPQRPQSSSASRSRTKHRSHRRF